MWPFNRRKDPVKEYAMQIDGMVALDLKRANEAVIGAGLEALALFEVMEAGSRKFLEDYRRICPEGVEDFETRKMLREMQSFADALGKANHYSPSSNMRSYMRNTEVGEK